MKIPPVQHQGILTALFKQAVAERPLEGERLPRRQRHTDAIADGQAEDFRLPPLVKEFGGHKLGSDRVGVLVASADGQCEVFLVGQARAHWLDLEPGGDNSGF
jgi:hypothetical protein